MCHYDTQSAVIQMGQGVVAPVAFMALVAAMAPVTVVAIVAPVAFTALVFANVGVSVAMMDDMAMRLLSMGPCMRIHMILARICQEIRNHNGMGRRSGMFGRPQGTGNRRRKRGESKDPEGQPDQPAVTVAATVHADGYPVYATRHVRKRLDANVP